MGKQELLETLRREGETKCAEIRRRANERLAELALRQAEEVKQLRSEAERERDALREQIAEAIAAGAKREAHTILLKAEGALASRLLTLARSSLSLLRREDYPGIFNSLAAELPPLSWGKVWINPADAPLAARLIPAAEIIPDDRISGGLAVETTDGKIGIDNTFEKRLSRGWPELLPLLFRGLGTGG